MLTQKWINAEKRKPPVNARWSESEYLYCREGEFGVPFVGWYNDNTKEWRVAHHLASNKPVKVSHWKKLPK